MTAIRKFYNMAVEILKEDLPENAPPLKLTKAMGYYGEIEKRSNKFIAVRLSTHHYGGEYDPTLWFDMETLLHLLNTICHELAHMTHWHHELEHKELTQKYLNKVMAIYCKYNKLAQVA